MPIARCHSPSGIFRSVRQPASLRLTAMAKSAPLARTASATLWPNNPESARMIGRSSPSGKAATARAMSEWVSGRGVGSPKAQVCSKCQAGLGRDGGIGSIEVLTGVVVGTASLLRSIDLDVGRVHVEVGLVARRTWRRFLNVMENATLTSATRAVSTPRRISFSKRLPRPITVVEAGTPGTARSERPTASAHWWPKSRGSFHLRASALRATP